MSPFNSLQIAFDASAGRFPDRPALEVDGHVWTYAALGAEARRLARAMREVHDGPLLAAVLASRSWVAYAGILGSLFAGRGYVPLHPAFPAARTADMLRRSGARALIVDTSGLEVLPSVLDLVPGSGLVIMAPDCSDLGALAARWPGHVFLPSEALPESPELQPVPGDPDDIANLLFTSGSTGSPKGVVVLQRNLRSFLDYVLERYDLDDTDRFSQTFDLVFDLSGFDLHAAWAVGGCVCVPDRRESLFPVRYARDRRLTVWFSVPSTAVLARQTRTLEEGSLPGLRYALFCGEALMADVARDMALAAPNAVIENLYGPTEVTLACTVYRWTPGSFEADCENRVVPLGRAFPHLRQRVVTESGRDAPPGEVGELWIAGPQVTAGYWNEPDRTAAVFVTGPDGAIWYRTGDRVRASETGPLQYLGRVDHQVKINGYRVELGEIEAALRDACGASIAVVVPWPFAAGHADAVHAFLSADATEMPMAKARLSERLPPYMVPRTIRVLEVFPLNTNGKIDRGALAALVSAVRGGGARAEEERR